MHYLKTYPDSIGISHYLCWRMKSMPYEEVEFYWPQIWYVAVGVYFARAMLTAATCSLRGRPRATHSRALFSSAATRAPTLPCS